MANAKGRARTRPRLRLSPAQTAALLGVAALVLLLALKLVGTLESGAGQGIVAQRADDARRWLGNLFERDGGVEEPPAVVALAKALKPFGIAASDIQRQPLPEVRTGHFRAERWDVPVPPRVSFIKVNLAVTRAATAAALDVLDAREEMGASGSMLVMALGADGGERYRLAFSHRDGEAGRGTVAVIINGIGAEWDATSEALLAFPAPLTWGVLPGHRSSRDIASAARARGIEVLLSMPMEPRGYPASNPGAGAILMDQGPAEIRARLRRAIESVGEVSGIVTYMGSMATTDVELMEIVLDETNRRGLFYVDSRAADRSVVSEVARRLGTPCVASSLFIDEEGDSVDVIEKRIVRLMDIAERSGRAVAIGHSTAETLSALQAALPEFAARGLDLVPVSMLVPARTAASVAGAL